MSEFDVIVTGAGPAGLSAACLPVHTPGLCDCVPACMHKLLRTYTPPHERLVWASLHEPCLYGCMYA